MSISTCWKVDLGYFIIPLSHPSSLDTHWSASCHYRLVCISRSSYKLYNGTCILFLFCLDSFTHHNNLGMYPCCCIYQQFISFYCWVVFHCTEMPQILYQFPCWWTCRFFGVGYYKSSCQGHQCTCVCMDVCFLFLVRISPKMKGLDHMIPAHLTFKEIARLFSKWLDHSCPPSILNIPVLLYPQQQLR